MEDQSSDGHLGLQGLDQVPGNGLTLPILICGQVEGRGVLEQILELLDLLLAPGGVDVDGLEVAFDVDSQARP